MGCVHISIPELLDFQTGTIINGGCSEYDYFILLMRQNEKSLQDASTHQKDLYFIQFILFGDARSASLAYSSNNKDTVCSVLSHVILRKFWLYI